MTQLIVSSRIHHQVRGIRQCSSVFGFCQPVSCQLTAAQSVGARVGQEDAVMIFHQPIAIATHAEAAIPHSVKQDNDAAVGLGGQDEPGTQGDAV